ncbi:MAG: hypothetical protein JOZ80_08905 [Acidobacteriaceae bacterium]|nr:hypothetical protein [Acidobacteriaceae bacterium]
MAANASNLAGWLLTVAALFILAANGNFGLLALLVPVSFVLACVMIAPAADPAHLPQNREKR